MWNAPYRGAARRMYLQAKVLELLAMHLDWLDGNHILQVLSLDTAMPSSISINIHSFPA
jgi:hypothetical protein